VGGGKNQIRTSTYYKTHGKKGKEERRKGWQSFFIHLAIRIRPTCSRKKKSEESVRHLGLKSGEKRKEGEEGRVLEFFPRSDQSHVIYHVTSLGGEKKGGKGEANIYIIQGGGEKKK